MELRSASSTHTGHVRPHNEDSLLVADPVFVVADGMGGHAAGEVASGLAVSAFAGLAGTWPVVPEQALARVTEANRLVLDAMRSTAGLDGMGTTLTGVIRVVNGPRQELLVFNIGDSRVYRVRAGRTVQLTRDHSAVQELVDGGHITVEQAAGHVHRHVVTRALGVPDVAPDVWFVGVAAGDRFVVATDGLTGEVDDAAIARICGAHDEASAAAEALVAEALAAGGRDNVTVVVVDVLVSDGVVDVESTVPREELEDAESTKPRLEIVGDAAAVGTDHRLP